VHVHRSIRRLTVLGLALLVAGCLDAPKESANARELSGSIALVPKLLDPLLAVGQDHALLKERVRAREIDVATDPNNPLHMAAVMMVPYPTQYPLAPYDSMQWTGIALSEDGGKTWDYEPIRGYPGDTEPGPFPGAWALGDGVLNFQPDGSLLLGVLPIRLPVIISVGVAEFPWGSREPTFVSEFARGALGVDGLHNVPTSQVGPHPDKEQYTIDPFTGAVYVTYSERWQQSSEARIMFAKSTDRGRTWTDPIPINPPQPHYIGSGQHQMGPWPTVTADGRLLVIWAELRSGSFYVSEAQGDGFAPPRLIAKNPGTWIPSVGVDRSGGPNHGTIYVTLADDRNGDTDVYLHVSRDGGETWDDAVRVNQDAIGNGRDLKMPELVVEPDGAVSVVYMQEVDAADAYYAFVARSIDGGRTFTEYQVSSAATSARSMNNQPTFLTHLGDYLGISYNDHGVVAVWQDGRKSTADTPYSEAWMVELPTR
jgi:hypothetical protein